MPRIGSQPLSPAAASATYALVPARAESLRVWGHSYVQGITCDGGNPPVDGFAPCLAEMLGLPLNNEGIGGSNVTFHNSPGSWAPVLQKVTRPRRFTAPHGLHVLMHGMNDLAALGLTAPLMAPFIEAVRVCISRWRAGAIFEQSDASVVLGGTGGWTLMSDPALCSGADLRYNTSVGATITITTPTDFPGGDIALGFTAWGPADGATISGTVNGTVYSVNTVTDVPNVKTGHVLRVPGLPSGSHAYVFTTTASAGVGTMFDYWQWEAPTPPLVVLVKQPKPVDLTAYGAGVVTDAGIDVLNAALDTIATEFGASVITVNTSSIDHSALCFIAGNVHPNRNGHRLIAEMIRDAVKGLVTPVPQRTIYAPRIEYGTAAPTATSRSFNVGDRVDNTAPAAGGYMGWVCTVAGAPGTWKTYGPITA